MDLSTCQYGMIWKASKSIYISFYGGRSRLRQWWPSQNFNSTQGLLALDGHHSSMGALELTPQWTAKFGCLSNTMATMEAWKKTPTFLSFDKTSLSEDSDDFMLILTVWNASHVVDLAWWYPSSHSDSGRLRPFLVQQRELCERADLDTTAEAAREVDLLHQCVEMGDVLEPFRF